MKMTFNPPQIMLCNIWTAHYFSYLIKSGLILISIIELIKGTLNYFSLWNKLSSQWYQTFVSLKICTQNAPRFALQKTLTLPNVPSTSVTHRCATKFNAAYRTELNLFINSSTKSFLKCQKWVFLWSWNTLSNKIWKCWKWNCIY